MVAYSDFWAGESCVCYGARDVFLLPLMENFWLSAPTSSSCAE